MKIAICDDDLEDLNLLKDYCIRYDKYISLGLFSNGSDLLNSFEDDFFDLIFLDIEMDDVNGMDVAAKLMASDKKPCIVFVTNFPGYAPKGYRLACEYLTKPIKYEKFSNTVNYIFEKITPKSISINVNGAKQIISVNEITYVDVSQHLLTLHLSDNTEIISRGSIAELREQLSGCSFAQSHKSYYINLNYVDAFTHKNVLLTNGVTIPIGRNMKEHFYIRLNAFMRERKI